MTTTLYDATVPVFTKALQAIHGWLDKANALAAEKQFDPETLLTARLAPDQFAFLRQVQIACDKVKGIAGRLAGKDVPAHPDTEKTIAELRQRINTTIEYLNTLTRADFVGAEDRSISLPFWQGQTMRGGDYLDHYALPNLYFHLTTAYAILRHNGASIGKMDFLGTLPFQPKA
jgi:hypothetical protein